VAARTAPVRPSLARLAGALLALTLLAAGCSEGSSGPEKSPAATEAADAGGASDAGGSDAGGSEVASGPSDGGGQSAAGVPQDPYPATPAPDGFVAPEACSGEGAHFVRVGETATPELPERAGETLTIEAVGIEGDDAQLTATIGDGSTRPIEDLTLGETASIDLWTISVTSVCEDTQQIEFDLIN